MWPVRHLINKLSAHAALRIASKPESHPIHRFAKQSARYIKRHRCPLHELFHAFSINPSSYEKIDPFLWSPKARNKLEISIEPSREEAVLFDKHLTSTVKLYSDGSGYEGNIAASAAMFDVDLGSPVWAAAQLGTKDERTVYEAEIIGMTIAVHLAANESYNDTVSLGVDNQAALKCLKTAGAKPGQQLVKRLADTIAKAKKRRRSMKLRGYWTPGHENVEGNEFADEKAKSAAKNGSQNVHLLPTFLQKPIPLSLAAKKQELNAWIKGEAQKQWVTSKYFEKTIKMDNSIATVSTKYINAISRLSKNRASLITQLRTGHIGLNRHLHKMGRADTPFCPHCPTSEETVDHFVIQCPKYDQFRGEMRQLGQREACTLATFIGQAKYFPLLLRYIQNTDRLTETFGKVAIEDWPD